MKIINQLTIRYLKENKKRTILTILCIAVSVIMISCVGISFYSGKQFYKEYVEETVGDYHYSIVTNEKRIIDMMSQDQEVKEYYFSSTEPYYMDDENNYRSFFNMKRGDSLYYEKENYKDLLIKGRLPENPLEIAISQYYLDTNKLDSQIGDNIIFLNNENKKNYEFKIVGIIDQYKAKALRKTSFEALGYIDLKDQDAWYTMYVQDKNLSNEIFKHVENIVEQRDQQQIEASIMFNSSYLAIQDIFEDNSQSAFLGIYRLIATILFIIVLLSIFIIYQAFNLSTNDRIQYLGMLSSVGATPKQKKRSVYFEGFVLSLISIPLGIIMSFIGLYITFLFINQLEMVKILNIKIHTSLSLTYLILVIIISLITIFISLYLPARKISKISVIDALKKNDEVKVNKRKLKIGFISKKFFHISWQMALKNYKRQGRRSQVIVFSLVISMVAFVSIFSFGQNLMQQTREAQKYFDYDLQINIADEQDEIDKLNQILDRNNDVNEYYYETTSSKYYAKIPQDYIYFDTNNAPFSLQDGYLPINMIGLNNEKIKKLCKELNIDYHENIALVDNSEISDGYMQEKYKQKFHKAGSNFIDSLIYKEDESIKSIEEAFDYTLFDGKKTCYDNEYEINIIVPIDFMREIDRDSIFHISYYIYADDYNKVEEELEQAGYSVDNYAQNVLQNRQMFLIMQIFIYGFVLIMIFFSVLNIINMMSASIDHRKKEFGMMLSIGMSPKGIQKMIRHESLIYGLKTLLYGIPISIGIEWLLYNQIYMEGNVFTISYLAYIISFLVIMIVMLLTFRVGLNKFKKQNIIETLKEDM